MCNANKLLTVVALLYLSATIAPVNAHSGCGILDRDPESTITLEALPDDLQEGVQIWDTTTYGVNVSTADGHPHYRYLNAFATSKSYYFKTSSAFRNFTQDQGDGPLLRNVTFTCLDGTKSKYYFTIPITITDKESPEFLDTDIFSFTITEDWPLYNNGDDTKSINQATFILVGDKDQDYNNAHLSFSTSLEGTSNDAIKIIGSPLFIENPPTAPFYYRVELYLKSKLEPGDHEFYIIAHSRLRTGSARVALKVTPA